MGKGPADIGAYAFAGCSSLTDVTLGNHVVRIGDWAFISTGLIGVLIPSSVTSIGAGAFRSCARLTGNDVDPLNPAYSSVDGILFNKNQTAIIGYPAGRAGGYTIPNGVTAIGAGAFSGCPLTSVVIPDSVTSIGAFAFSGCPLTNVAIPHRVTSIGEYTFSGCTTLTNVTIGHSVASIGAYAFVHCTSLTSVSIADSVTSIWDSAFFGCDNLTTVTMGRGVAELWDLAFTGCISLTGVFFWGNAPSYVSDSFLGCPNATAYYLPGTTGWGPTFARLPTALWVLPNPVILTTTPSFGVQTNQFGFVISWATNASVVVEACTDLALPDWSPVGTNTLVEGWSYFSDPEWTNYASRFYRLRSP